MDSAVARRVRDSGIEEFMLARSWLRDLIKAFGEYPLLLVVMLIVAMVHPLRWRAGAFVLGASAAAGINGAFKWIIGRTRPFKLDEAQELLQPFTLQPFRGGLERMFDGRNLCFPSGHTCLAFATAAAVAMLWPRSRWPWIGYGLATVVGLERIAENAHWTSDIVAAAGIGVAVAYLVARAAQGWESWINRSNPAPLEASSSRSGESSSSPADSTPNGRGSARTSRS